ncbi:MAG TPA: outer membrane beta-barrel protein [Chitinophagaceae bacterium]
MKKIYLSVFTVLSFYFVSAQTEQGNWLVGGNFNLSTVSNNTSIGLNPTAGYFVMNNLAVGGTVTLMYDKLGENSSTTFGLGPMVRYYFGKSNIRPFVDGEMSFISEKFKYPGGTNTENGVGYFLGMGLALFLNENVALETLAGYTHTNISEGSKDGGFAMRIGFQVYLNSRRSVENLRNTD